MSIFSLRYLHVAICRTDPYLVKAILERLVRENLLKELIDRPNKKRQVGTSRERAIVEGVIFSKRFSFPV